MMKQVENNYEKWKQWLIDKLDLDDFYMNLLNKKGITRDYIIQKKV